MVILQAGPPFLLRVSNKIQESPGIRLVVILIMVLIWTVVHILSTVSIISCTCIFMLRKQFLIKHITTNPCVELPQYVENLTVQLRCNN